VLVAVAIAWFVVTRRSEAPSPATAPRVPVATAREGFVERSVTVSGRVGSDAGTQTKLAFSIPGIVRSVDVRLGDRVEAGAALAQIDPTSYSLAARQAGAEAQAAAANADVAAIDRTSVKLRVDQAELRRQERLYAAGIVARRDVEAAQATVAADHAESQAARDQASAAQASSRSAGARSASAQYDLTRTVLRAPATGIVTGIFVQAGETVDAATAAIAVAPASTSVATLDVPVSSVAQIRPGDAVHASANGRHFEARVAGVASAVNPGTGLAVVSIAGVPAELPPGTPVDARVVVGEARGLVVPRGAVVVDPENGNTLVFVQTRDRNGTERFASRIVTIDAQNDSSARVTSGLHAGERLAAQGGIDLLAPSGGGD
jgi:cobalt-zinc-cadmium efflux system membrane fusion protein